jgi:translation initiation factor IF-2
MKKKKKRMNRKFFSLTLSMLNQKHYLNIVNTTRTVHTSINLNYSAQVKAARDKLKKLSKRSQLLPIQIKQSMTIRELADAMERPPSHVVTCLDQISFMPGVNKRDSFVINNLNTIIKVVQLSGFRHRFEGEKKVDFDELEKELTAKDDSKSKRSIPDPRNLIRRPPVITIMGHVDHGKTTLLDSLRGSNIVEKEFGGITQHIGAFNVSLSGNDEKEARNITFLDTPGHAAFSMMRSRGAKITDIVVLVIAAEDGIMEQTIESIYHAKKTRCPIIVAINKIDKCNEKQIESVKQQLLKYDLIPEEMGGDTQVVPISALKKTNLDRLKEEIWTRAEIMELKGDPKGLVEGYIIESFQDIHRGKIATVLVTRGSLKKGDFLVAGNSWCKVKQMNDENANNLSRSTLSQAVQIIGWKDLPNAGDEVLQVQSEHKAKEIIDVRHKIENLHRQKLDYEAIQKKRHEHDKEYKLKLKDKIKVSLLNNPHLTESTRSLLINNLNRQMSMNISEDYSKIENIKKDFDPSKNKNSDIIVENKIKKNSLPIIVKTDVNGSLEAILNVLETYDSNDKVFLDLIHFEVGPIKKFDLELAETFNAIIYCFNLPVQQNLESQTNKKIRIRHHNVIYKLFDDLLIELNEKVPLVEQEEMIGQADVLKTFEYDLSNNKSIQVAGGKCMDGYLDKKMLFKLVRNGSVISERLKCHSLKHLKNDVNTIKCNVDFGLAFEDQLNAVPKPGDKIICYNIKMVKSPIDWNLGF